ncbi:Cas10/Cmr2 second palm domain-containing protein [Alkalinema pantanalense CENA528]|uniref:Cas10/Cmr2 second palm domain-containing protein n=1 Tax=Alkalinema pantanalense TaxID=1620705 RepID=UPI003D6E64BB
MTIYTAISFAPVQGFIEKSRKLRDLHGASLILSYLSSKLVEKAQNQNFEVISPGLVNVKEGMPNRILIKGSTALNRDDVKNTLIAEWGAILDRCRIWVERRLDTEQYQWSQLEEDKGIQKGEWERWKSYNWEVFWGYGSTVAAAMEDLENRKLKRDWIGINWVGESSSLSGTDAIAWPGLGQESNRPWEWSRHQDAVTKFYEQLASSLEKSADGVLLGNFLDPSERLSIPELVKRLITRYEDIGQHFGKDFRFDSLSEMVRLPQSNQPGHWTGWFMGDGDSVGDHLKELAKNPNDIQPLKTFSDAMRKWGQDFKRNFSKDLDLGRVIYAGGDDFLGVIYSKDPKAAIPEHEALQWLMGMNQQWQAHGQPITLSVGFVWAGHSVPQRDVLQHCREAEKRAKTLGKNRVTIRVLFNSGQYVQWTCPWNYLDILTKYRDRDGINTQEEIRKGSEKRANWNHLYSDWATLKARHAIRLGEMEGIETDTQIAQSLFDFYFDDAAKNFESQQLWIELAGDNTAEAIVNWMDDLIQVGWQLCRNSDR